ncbi:hypothetical protein SAMN05216571_101367 [Onishia taeanensis]|uniref:Uncharacterized protein n=1 Tax=Onishia taeanensis TaxID=284577 RepID=A0A1G7NF33_9GAMM|nr:hypothetical protein [Halomonas taeanensis]SDF71890.1 hypothetical protein SAMN05216571_101367 [Halomonas taeanensis]
MTRASHTHKTEGGRFVVQAETPGSGPLEGQVLVVYLDLDKEVSSATTKDDWRQHWKEIALDDCALCLGSGRDAIKGNKANPCGGCYGLGKVRMDGGTPEDRWQLADVAMRIIQRQRTELQRLATLDANPAVQALLKRQQNEAIGEQEQQWRAGPGRGHGGRRHTGD